MVMKDEAGGAQTTTELTIKGSELYKRCQNREEGAWAYLNSWCQKRAARKLPASLAEDIAQLVCVKLLDRGLESVMNPKAFYGFMATAVDRAVIDALRKTGREVSLDNPISGEDLAGASFGDQMPGNEPDPVRQAAARQALEDLTRAIRELPGYCNEVMPLYIRYKLGLEENYETMADRLGVPINTLSVQIRRCLQGLKKMPQFSWLSAQRR